MFTYFLESNLTFENQSGFKLGDSCVNQSLAITREMFSNFDGYYEVREVFLEISKPFDGVRHEWLIHKLKRNGISGNLLNHLIDFIWNRKQRVIFNGQSPLVNINDGVTPGSMLGPQFFPNIH